jgi:hypothetical protein
MENSLIGKTLAGMKIAEDKQALLFQAVDGDLVARCDGDCCSQTWVENVDMPALGFPATVLAVEDIDMPDLGDMDGCDVVAYYGCKITTDKGDILIDYRNDSNGYYGGSLTWPGERHYGGVFNQNESKEVWRDIAP